MDDGQGVFVLVAFVLMLLFAAKMVSTGGDRERYEKPKIVNARSVCWNGNRWGEFEVTSSHGIHLLREMNLPAGSIVRTVERNKLYVVEFPIHEKRTPDQWETEVFTEDGRRIKEKVYYPDDAFARDFVKDWARANGYEGTIYLG